MGAICGSKGNRAMTSRLAKLARLIDYADALADRCNDRIYALDAIRNKALARSAQFERMIFELKLQPAPSRPIGSWGNEAPAEGWITQHSRA